MVRKHATRQIREVSMIVREIQDYRVIDITTNTVTSQPLDYRIILAPLLYWRIELYERALNIDRTTERHVWGT